MSPAARSRGLAAAVVVLLASLNLGGAALWAGAKFNKVVNLGDPSPEWAGLPGVDGKQHALADYREAPVLVLVFICNHCPMASAYEERLIELTRQYAPQKAAVVAVSVSRLEIDGLAKMQARAKERGFNFPYLHDASQQLGRKLGAYATPHVFVFDRQRKIVYMGAFDDQQDPARVERRYVRDAMDAVLAGRAVATPESRPRGCAIEYETVE